MSCLLCAKEHLRSAEAGELGGLFQARAIQKDLHQLVENVKRDNAHVFADARDEVAGTKRAEQRTDAEPRNRIPGKGERQTPF